MVSIYFPEYPNFQQYLAENSIASALPVFLPVILFVRRQLNYPDDQTDAFYNKSCLLNDNLFERNDQKVIDYDGILTKLIVITISFVHNTPIQDNFKKLIISRLAKYLDDGTDTNNDGTISDNEAISTPSSTSTIEIDI